MKFPISIFEKKGLKKRSSGMIVSSVLISLLFWTDYGVLCLRGATPVTSESLPFEYPSSFVKVFACQGHPSTGCLIKECSGVIVGARKVFTITGCICKFFVFCIYVSSLKGLRGGRSRLWCQVKIRRSKHHKSLNNIVKLLHGQITRRSKKQH